MTTSVHVRREKGYWKDPANIEEQLRSYLAESDTPDVMPTGYELTNAGLSDLARGINRYHDYSELANRFGLRYESTRKPRGYWENPENLEREIREFAVRLGTPNQMPTRDQLAEAGRHDLLNAISKKQYGGFHQVGAQLGLKPPSSKPNGYWDEFLNLKNELLAFIASRGQPGVMPSTSVFSAEGRSDLPAAFWKHGGLVAVARRLGLHLAKQQTQRNRDWSDPEVLVSELRKLQEEHGLPSDTMPRYTDFVAWNRTDLYKAMRRHYGGAAAVAQHLGMSFRTTDLMVRRKDAKKRVSTYGETYLSHVHPTSGRIHANYRLIGAASGRMACSRPNMQNLPREANYRRCIRPPAGRVLIKANYSQIELRIVAQVSGDIAMQEAFRAGEDLHTKTACAVLGREPTPRDRQPAKALNFGLLYGMGAPRLRTYAQDDYGVTLSEGEAVRFRQRFFQTYPGLRAWHHAQREGEVTTSTLAGRPRYGVNRFTEKLNSPVQGTGADILKGALARLWADRASVPSAALVLAVHDEIVVEVDAGEAEACAAWLIAHMTAAGAALLADVPVAVDANIVADWSGMPALMHA